jgi:hypothetical protein
MFHLENQSFPHGKTRPSVKPHPSIRFAALVATVVTMITAIVAMAIVVAVPVDVEVAVAIAVDVAVAVAVAVDVAVGVAIEKGNAGQHPPVNKASSRRSSLTDFRIQRKETTCS